MNKLLFLIVDLALIMKKPNNISGDANNYYPDLFIRENETISQKEILGDVPIPQNSLYEASAQPRKISEKKYLTIFGYSVQNRKNILEKIKQIVSISKIEEGKNYLNVWCEELEDYEKLLTINHTVFNGEIIGVYRNNFGLVHDEEIYKERRSFFSNLISYFFNKS